MAPPNATKEERFEVIKSGWFYFPDQFWNSVSADAKEVITLMLDLDPGERPTARKLLKHRCG